MTAASFHAGMRIAVRGKYGPAFPVVQPPEVHADQEELVVGHQQRNRSEDHEGDQQGLDGQQEVRHPGTARRSALSRMPRTRW